MKKSKRPVFKLNTSELPKNYKQPIKSKKRLGRGPRRIVRSRRRNEFIPEGADWCEINGAKLRQDIFFGEKRGRKFIPDGPLNFFVPSVPEGAGAELLEAPYGDGGDGGACGCACEGCVCGEGEGCSCSGPGTEGDFGQGAQDGQQGQQSSGQEGQQSGQEGQQSGQEGQQGQQQGQEGPSFSDPTGSTLSNDAFFGTGPSYSDPTGSTLSNDAFFGTGPSYSDPTGSTLSNDAFFGTGPSYSDPTGSTLSNDAFFGTGPSYSDPTGSTLSNDAFFGTGPAFTSDPSGRSGMDMDFDPHSIMDLPSPQDIQNMNPDMNPAIAVPDINTIGQLQGNNFLGAQGTFGPVTGPLDIGIPTNQSRGIDPNDLPSLDPDMGLGKGFITDPTSAPQTPDARGAVQGLMQAIEEAGRAASQNFGFVGKANAEPTSQFGPLTSSLFGPNYTANPLAENPFSNPLSNIQSQFQTGPLVGPNPVGFSLDPGKSELPGLPTNPEAPTNPMVDAQGRSVTNPDTFAVDRGPTDLGRTMDAPHTVMMDPGRTVGPQDQPSLQEFWGEKGPGVPALTNPFADNPDILDAPNQYTGQQAPSWVTGEFGNQTMGRDAPTNWGNPDPPTEAQMQAAKDAMTELAGREQSQNPLSDLFGRDVTNPSIFAPTPDDKGRTMDEPHNYPSLQELFDAREQQLADKGRTMDEPHQYPSLQELFDAREQQLSERDFTAKELQQERQSEREQQARDKDLEKQEQRSLERAQERSAPPVAPSRGQERGQTRGQERGAPLAPTSRGTPSLGRGPGFTNLGPNLGRDAPGVQGLPAGLRGNDLAQALVSRGFDPNLVGAALTINDGGKMLSSMLETAGLSHTQAMQTANAARGAVEAQFGLPSNRR